MQKHPPEEAVTVVGSLIFVVGLNALCQSLLSQSFHWTFFALWFGYGLWQGRKDSWGIVLALSLFGLMLVGFAGCLAILRVTGQAWELPTSLNQWLDSLRVGETVAEQLMLLGLFSLLAYVVWTLSRRDVKDLFNKNEPIVVNPRPLMISVVLITLLFETAILVNQSRQDQAVNQLAREVSSEQTD